MGARKISPATGDSRQGSLPFGARWASENRRGVVRLFPPTAHCIPGATPVAQEVALNPGANLATGREHGELRRVPRSGCGCFIVKSLPTGDLD